MHFPIGLVLLAAIANAPQCQSARLDSALITRPALVEVPKRSNGLTLYNANGEVVAKCVRRNDMFVGCKMEPGVTLDDLMNAWVHAYLDIQK